MVHILNIYEIKHVVKTYYEDNLKKDKYASHKKIIENQFSKELSSLFEEMLLRKIDNKGMKQYISLLIKNEITIEEVRKEIINSQEYFDRIETHMENIPKEKLQESKLRVSNLFIETLHREADKQGLRRYSLSLASGGMTEKEIKDEMMNSEEYFRRIKLDGDNISEEEIKKCKKIVKQCYIDILHRKPDNTGLVRYTLALGSGKITEEQIKKEISNSPEARDISLFERKENAKSK
jgi:hypothetical protein